MLIRRPISAGIHLGQLVFVGVALAALYGFLQDFMSPDWRAGIVAPLLMIGFGGALSAVPRDGMLRAAMWQGALVLVPFMGTYGLLDLLFASDVPAWVISPIVVVGAWLLFSQVVEAEAD